MQLFYSFTSPYARKVRVVLLEKGIVFEGIDVTQSEVQPSSVNPLGKVPTLVMADGTALYDSAVITETLDALYPLPKLIPDEPLARATVRRWEALADGVCDVLIPVVFDGRRPVEHQDISYCEKLLSKVRKALEYIERSVSGRQYLHDEGFSLADVAVVSMLGYVNLRRPDLLESSYVELKRYHGEQLERPSLRETIPPNLPVPSR